MCVGGVGIGALPAFGGPISQRIVSDWRIGVSASLVIAKGSFLTARSAGTSGVLVGMTAGFFPGSWGPNGRLERESSRILRHCWEFAACVVDGLVFLLIGLVIDWRIVVDH
jgi:NhaP-type Na+/H+ or K+/H+ antiporter